MRISLAQVSNLKHEFHECQEFSRTIVASTFRAFLGGGPSLSILVVSFFRRIP